MNVKLIQKDKTKEHKKDKKKRKKETSDSEEEYKPEVIFMIMFYWVLYVEIPVF